MSRPLISFDWALKKLLRNKANFVILEGFLSELLKKDVTVVSILESESNMDRFDSKTNRVDLLVENAEKERIIIEIQYGREYAFLYRMLFATAKHITESFEKGGEYADVKKVYSINLVYFDLGHGKDYVYHGKNEFRGLHYQDILQLSETQKTNFGIDQVYQIYPEYYLIKINQFDEVAKDSLDQWIYYFKTNQVKDEFTAKGLKEVKEYLRIENLDRSEKLAYDKFLENLSSEKGILKTAYLDGKLDVKKELILKALSRGKLSPEEIAENFDVGIKTVLEIKNEAGF